MAMSRMISFWLTAAGVALMACGAAAAPACEPQRVAEKYPAYAGRVVRIAADPTVPPFTFTDPTDMQTLTGVEADILVRVFRCAGLKAEFVLGNWNGGLAGLFTGAMDVMAGNVNYTPDRAQKADYVVFMRNGSSVSVRPGNPTKIHGTEDLCGARIAVGLASSSRREVERISKTCVEAGKLPAAIQLSEGVEPAYRMLPNERVDAVMDSASSLSARMAASPGKYDLAFTLLTNNVSGPVVAKGNTTMLRVVHDGLLMMEQSGELRALMAKYGLPDELLVPVEVRN